MRANRRGLAANAALAFAGDGAAKGGMFVALLVLARGLSVDAFARLGVAMAAMLIVTSLLDGGIGLVATRDGAAKPGLRHGLLRSGLSARLPLAAVSTAACLAAGALLGEYELAAVVLICAIVNAAQLAVFATFRSAQTLVNEALAKGFCGLSYPLCCAIADATGHRSATAALLSMTIGPALTLPPLLLSARAVTPSDRTAVSPLALLRRAAPFGLIALATLVYYRAPLLMMGVLSTPSQTASYSVAANLAFGLLMLPAAFATGLLPRLAAEADPARRAQLVRRTLAASGAILAAVEVALAATASWLVPGLYGRVYQGAVTPFLILLVSCLAIGAAGIVGTALVASDRRATVVRQVVIAVAVNLAASAVAIPRLGADGAALATLVTETAGLAFLAAAYARGGATFPVPAAALTTSGRKPVLAP